MKVLIAYDGSACADAAIDDLRNAGLPRETEVLVVSVANHGWPPHKHPDEEPGQFDSPWKATLADAEAFAESARVRIQSRFPGWHVSGEALWGAPSNILLKTIDHWKPDLLVVGSHGRTAAGRFVLGSVSLELVHQAPCSVRVVRTAAETPEGPIRVLAATDGSDQGQEVIHEIARRSWPEGTEVRVVSVLQSLVPVVPVLVPALEGLTYASEPAFQVIEEADERERARLVEVTDKSAERLQNAGLEASVTVVDGSPRTAILLEAERWHANTVFVGARGLGPVNRLLLGSVSTAVVTHAHCSVEVVRQRV